MSQESELSGIVKQVRQRVECERFFGVDAWPVRPRAAKETEQGKPMTQPEPTSLAKPKAKTPRAAGGKQGALDQVRAELEACDRCRLCGTRSNLVFGVGNPEAKVMFIGEAPGADEDRQGEPFVGRAGQLLTRIIEAMGLKREEVYIANILKCRPPENRAPRPDEIVHCLPYLRRQIEIIQPQVMVFLGNIAAQTLLETTEGISRLRGRFYEYQGIKVMCTYHPAYLLRNPDAKRQVWEDVQKVMEALGLGQGKA